MQFNAIESHGIVCTKITPPLPLFHFVTLKENLPLSFINSTGGCTFWRSLFSHRCISAIGKEPLSCFSHVARVSGIIRLETHGCLVGEDL